MQEKSSVKEIKERFDQDVERFSNLETGQASTVDARSTMDLICASIFSVNPMLENVLDIGCGAGNYGVKLLEKINPIQFTLVDLSLPMLTRAKERIDVINSGSSTCIQGDFREVEIAENKYDVIIATAVLHHLRDDQDWEKAFKKLYQCLRPGGSIWIFDLVKQSNSTLQNYIYGELYGQYLTDLKDENYRNHVFEYIEKEDSPRSLYFQLELLKKVGFREVDVLSKNLCFSSFVAFK